MVSEPSSVPYSPSDALPTGDESARRDAIKRIERKRRFWLHTGIGALAMLLLVAVWASAEYHNAGGWPTQGFSQSSGIHDVWNGWIIYPAIAFLFITAVRAWLVFGPTKPVSEEDIEQEMRRQAGK